MTIGFSELALAAVLLGTIGTVKQFGAGWGIAALVGLSLTSGVVAAQMGIQLGSDDCTRYSSFADDC
ncbi:hypothetical protein GOA77_09125 [Sinorhizobium meliloti]|nr:hypothetical protein [Sinorhizobium meliloti]MDW9656635.1 hypothetical protein [Sinorhizobium meliloti]MDW9902027.1 hypothetical protein [Sinorhizobium meliloti]MDW9916445.1 hypothetical protein [Sinorhizobium meliloti]MDW9939566.1 hypothetical protein [Sinorhizobium meliloti]